jgi:hypothetical protein
MTTPIPKHPTYYLTRHKAIQSLLPPGTAFSLGNEEIVCTDETVAMPTEQEISNAIALITQQEQMSILREQRDKLLSETDWYIISAQEKGTSVPENVLRYRQELRDFPSTIKQVLEVDEKTGKLKNIVFPTL